MHIMVPIRIASALTLALTAAACASGASIPIYPPDRPVRLSESDVTQIRVAAVRYFRQSERQIMCIGVTAGHEESRNEVDAPQIFLDLLGSPDRYRRASDCSVSAAAASGARPLVTANGQTATTITLLAPFGFAEGRAVVNVQEGSRSHWGHYRCEALRNDGVWGMVRCRRDG